MKQPTRALICSYLLFWNLLAGSCALSPTPAYAAISAATAWEVRPTAGADTNGCAFITGATGTDFSQQNAAQYTATDLVAVTNNTVSSVSHAFIATDVGNTMNITAGTGFTTGFFQILSVLAGVATLDRDVGTAPLTGGTYAVGGACATISKTLTANVTGNKVFVKASGTLAVPADIPLNNNVAASSGAPINVLQGYTTTRTDMGRATLQITADNVTAINAGSNAGWLVQNFIIDCNGHTGTTGVQSFWFSTYRSLKIMGGCTSRGLLNQGNRVAIEDVEITGCASCDAALYMNGEGSIVRSYVHDNTAIAGVRLNVPNIFVAWTISANNTLGGAADCFSVPAANANINMFQNVGWGCDQDGLNLADGALLQGANFRNNIFGNNGRYGFNGSSIAGAPAWPMYDGNFYFSNATANRHNMDDTGTTNAINGAAPYTNTLDVILSGNPFTNSAAGDFTLNNTAGAGAAVRGAGTPGTISGATGAGHIDGGALQHLDSGGGGSTPNAGAYAQ
jgi:hypothetical protein